jgi:hypothetical protein
MSGKRLTGKLASLARSVGWGHNTLRRRSDRIESVTLLVAILVAFAAIPLATSVGTMTYHHGLAVATREAAAGHPVPATLLQDAPAMVPGAVTVDEPVRARWTYPDGVRHTGTISVPDNSRAGSRVTIWTDPSGSLIKSPLTPDQAWARGGLTALGVFGGVLAALVFAVAIVRHRLNLARYGAWGEDWQRIASGGTRSTN